MDLVEENGDHNGDPLKFEREEDESPGPVQTIVLPQTLQSVIQPTQASVIQSTPALSTKGNLILVNKPANSVIHTATGGGGNSGGTPTIQTLHLVEARDGDLLEDDATKKRREILARRPSYRKILNELGGGEISVEERGDPLSTSESSQDTEGNTGSSGSRTTLAIGGTHYQTTTGLLKVIIGSDLNFEIDLFPFELVIPASAIQLTSQGGNDGLASLQTLTMANAGSGGTTLVQYAQGQDGQFFVPVCVGAGDIQTYTLRPATSTASGSNHVVIGTSSPLGTTHVLTTEDAVTPRKREIRLPKGGYVDNDSKDDMLYSTHSGGEEWEASEPAMQKRELRLLKNREAARECRRKKKEYIKCLENRVAVLENQNKALIEELKSLKELYCSQKPE
nr:EOG090X0DMT [Lepidurus arcticus]